MHKDLENAITNDTLVLFVGAGMSMPLGFPSWNGLIIEILKDLKEELGETSNRFNFPYYNSLGNNIDVFDVLDDLERCNHKQRVKDILHKKIKSVDFASKSLENHKKLWKISSKIITTNYDKILEEVKPIDITSFTNNNDFQQRKSLQGNPFLYKIHGDIENPDTCVLFTSDYSQLYQPESSNKDTLNHFFNGKTILFVGFSLDDPFVKKQVEYIHNLYKGYTNTHFLISKGNKDLSALNINTISIDNWNEAFDEKLDELIALKEKSQPTLPSTKIEEDSVDITVTDDTVVLEKLLDEKKEEFHKAEDHEKKALSKELYKIRDRILEIETNKFDIDFQQFIPQHKEKELEYIFDEIFKSEKLSPKLIQDINKIRELHSGKNEWYHRSVLVSALACSLINSKKLDPRKLDLLIDFTNDNEEKVWQKAITYLFLMFTHLGNKWIKHANVLEPKLRSLRERPKIQEALKDIISLMQQGLQEVSLVNEKIFENEYFKDNPFNYFLPFYENNLSVDNLYEDDTLDDVKGLVQTLYNLPFSDSFKYLLCNTTKISKEEKVIKTDEDKDFSKIMFGLMLSLHSAYEPYLNHVNDFINFYKNNPKYLKEVKQDVTIIKIKNLKNLLLSAVEEHRAMARQFMLEKEWGKASTRYEQLLEIEDEDKDALLNLIQCYEAANKNEDDKLKLRLRIEKFLPEDHENLYEIARIYRGKRKYKIALKYIDKGIKRTDKIARYYVLRAEFNVALKKIELAIQDLDLAIKINDLDADIYVIRGYAKSCLKEYEYKDVILDLDKAIELDDKIADNYEVRGSVKHDKKDYQSALLDYNKAIELDNKNPEYYLKIASTYRRLKLFDKANQSCDKASKLGIKEGKDIGTKATIYASEGNDELFYEYLEKAFQAKAKASWLEDDIREKYKDEKRFQELLAKYNQTLEDED